MVLKVLTLLLRVGPPDPPKHAPPSLGNLSAFQMKPHQCNRKALYSSYHLGNSKDLKTKYIFLIISHHHILTKKDLSQEWPDGLKNRKSVYVIQHIEQIKREKGFQ